MDLTLNKKGKKMKIKNIVFSGAMASILMMGVANAAVDGTDVNFDGKYELTSGAEGDATVAPVSSNYKYDYTTTGGTQTGVVNTTDPNKSLFTYTAAAGSAATDMNTTHVQADYTGTSAVDGTVVKTTQDIVSGATIDNSKYTYQDAQDGTQYVEYKDTARTLEKIITVDDTYVENGQYTMTSTDTTSLNGEAYKYTWEQTGQTYTLSADGTKLINSNHEEVTPYDGLIAVFNDMKAAYTNDKTNVADAAYTQLLLDQTTENSNHQAAADAITTDTNTITSLDTDWGTYQTAEGLLKTAQDAQAAAKKEFSDDTDAYNTANGIYTAPITDTIDTRANNAIAASLTEEDGAIKVAINNETTRAQDVEGDLNDLTTTEKSNLVGAINENTGAIAAEATRATAAEATLQTAINNETTRAQGAEATLQNNIDAEATARANADLALQAEINDAVYAAKAGDALTLKSANDYTDAQVDTLEKNVSGGIAAATALSAVEVSNVKKGEMSVGGGYGYYNGESAGAFGMAMGLSDNWSVNAGAGVASGDKTQVSFRAGTNYKFKLF